MDDKIDTVVEGTVETDTSGATDTTDNSGVETEETTLTMTQDELDKMIQSENDKLRKQYSKQIKELEAKVKELTPVQKSEAELDYEKRLAALEAREKAVALDDSLKANGISKEMAKYLRDDVDVPALAETFKKIVGTAVDERLTEDGFVPTGHKSGNPLTKDDFKKMNMSEKERLYQENPDLYKSLSRG
ncbi:MAG: hypothetical protein IJZ33_04785 [Clostridia bacterium]|nr:hypothetical protein [Clostridia bacterium]